jgi:hypothetical protein
MFDFDVISGPSPAELRRAQREAQQRREPRSQAPRAGEDKAEPPVSEKQPLADAR